MKAHIFDVDHTLMRSSTGLCFIRKGIAAGCFSVFDLLKIPFFLLQYKRGILNIENVAAKLPLFKGLGETRLFELGRETFKDYVQKRLYLDASQLLHKIQADGGRIILATSSFDFLITPIMDFFGIKEAICSRLEFREGYCTGAVAGPLAFGRSKSIQVMKYLDDNKIRLQDCVAYSDSVYDLPLLEAVSTAVAVNPDKKLFAHAKKAGWIIQRWKTCLDHNN
ncbi:MAG: HAD-IB family hydrolase [Spirochaetaceae bacterium]|nr:MAG: HAD-IB family hydrolase [Spirochaetaceae bacterium]